MDTEKLIKELKNQIKDAKEVHKEKIELVKQSLEQYITLQNK